MFCFFNFPLIDPLVPLTELWICYPITLNYCLSSLYLSAFEVLPFPPARLHALFSLYVGKKKKKTPTACTHTYAHSRYSDSAMNEHIQTGTHRKHSAHLSISHTAWTNWRKPKPLRATAHSFHLRTVLTFPQMSVYNRWYSALHTGICLGEGAGVLLLNATGNEAALSVLMLSPNGQLMSLESINMCVKIINNWEFSATAKK